MSACLHTCPFTATFGTLGHDGEGKGQQLSPLEVRRVSSLVVGRQPRRDAVSISIWAPGRIPTCTSTFQRFERRPPAPLSSGYNKSRAQSNFMSILKGPRWRRCCERSVVVPEQRLPMPCQHTPRHTARGVAAASSGREHPRRPRARHTSQQWSEQQPARPLPTSLR
eukprot:scaffold1158_cov27-Tisochrysis_lutea.AAC.3